MKVIEFGEDLFVLLKLNILKERVICLFQDIGLFQDISIIFLKSQLLFVGVVAVLEDSQLLMVN